MRETILIFIRGWQSLCPSIVSNKARLKDFLIHILLMMTFPFGILDQYYMKDQVHKCFGLYYHCFMIFNI